MMQGTIPYPAWANSGPIRQLATSMQRFGAELTSQSDLIMNIKDRAEGSWTGMAARAFGQKQNERSQTMRKAATLFAKMAAPLNSFATLIDTTKAQYQTAVAAEMAARATSPFSAAALAKAILWEKQIVFMQFYGGGTTIAGQLAAIEAEAALLMFTGVDRAQFTAWKDLVVNGWKQVADMFGDDATKREDAVRQFNELFQSALASAGTERTNPIASDANLSPCLAGGIEALSGALLPLVLLDQPVVSATPASPEVLAELRAAGFDTGTSLSSGARAMNFELLSGLSGARGDGTIDQSVPVHAQLARRGDGSQVLTLTIPGMLSPDVAVMPNGSGTRVLPYAASSQMSGTGQFEAAMLEFVAERGLQPGDTVNLYGYSQGGIVSRNMTESLRNAGYDVNLVTYGSPDGPMGAGTTATMYQNTRDVVPLTRLGGAGAETLQMESGQRIVQFDAGASTPGRTQDQHAIGHYGRWLDANAGHPDVRAELQRAERIYTGATVVDDQILMVGTPAPARGERVLVTAP